jgi:hypothetical protein
MYLKIVDVLYKHDHAGISRYYLEAVEIDNM